MKLKPRQLLHLGKCQCVDWEAGLDLAGRDRRNLSSAGLRQHHQVQSGVEYFAHAHVLRHAHMGRFQRAGGYGVAQVVSWQP